MRTNNAEALAAMLCEGAGIGALPMATALAPLRSGAIVRVLPAHRVQAVTLSVLYASRMYLDAKVSTWVEFLRETIPLRLKMHETELKRLSAMASGVAAVA
jgi:DNA-binding transcriptional LysR family regulator